MKKICLFIICLFLFVPLVYAVDTNSTTTSKNVTTQEETTTNIESSCEASGDCTNEGEETSQETEETSDDGLLSDGKSAILIEASTGKIIYEKNSHDRYAPASMTKIMSMIIIIEEIENGNLKWNETLVASEYAASMGGSQIFLQPNEKMTVKDLFKAVAIGSANDVAVTKKQSLVISEEIII